MRTGTVRIAGLDSLSRHKWLGNGIRNISGRGYLAHPFSASIVQCMYQAAAAAMLVLTRPLPEVAGVCWIDARRALSMNFEVRIYDIFSMW
jgi:hypothetical protein